MKKFLVIYHAPVDAMAQTAESTPEERAAGMEAWSQWASKCGDKLVDMGSPLTNGMALDVNGEMQPSTKDVTGYSVLQAEDLEELDSLLDGHPHLNGWSNDCTIEVHEFMSMEM